MALGRRYSVDGQRACAASAPQTILGITATTAVRPFIYDLLLGSSATPADNAILWYIGRYTAAGTSTAVTPQALDSGDPASTTTAGKNHTVDPTYTANAILFHLALNQRASHRWIGDPNGPMICPATANNGMGLYASNASFTGNIDATIHFAE
jgi:hypothetical protein